MKKHKELTVDLNSSGWDKAFKFKAKNLVEDDILYQMRILLYHSRNGRISQLDLVEKLKQLNESVDKPLQFL